MVLLTVVLLSAALLLLLAALLDFASVPLAQRRAITSVAMDRTDGGRRRVDLVQEWCASGTTTSPTWDGGSSGS